MDISFAWTTKALVAGRKDVTRRGWSEKYAQRFRPGMVCAALDRQRRFGGKLVGKIRIVSVRREPLKKLLVDLAYGLEEIRREGGLWGSIEEFVWLFLERGIEEPVRVEFVWLGKEGE